MSREGDGDEPVPEVVVPGLRGPAPAVRVRTAEPDEAARDPRQSKTIDTDSIEPIDELGHRGLQPVGRGPLPVARGPQAGAQHTPLAAEDRPLRLLDGSRGRG